MATVAAGAATFRSAFPIGDSKTDALPIRAVGPAVGYYTQVLGFTEVSRDEKGAVLRRDEVTIGLAVNGEDPEQASVYFDVSDVDALREELAAKGIAPSEIRVDRHGGKDYRVFFAQEPYGVCFCFGQPAA